MANQFELSKERAQQIRAAALADGLAMDEWIDRELQRSLRRRQIENFTEPDADTVRWMSASEVVRRNIWSQTAATEVTGR